MSATAVSPAPVWDLINGYSAYWAVVAALDLGVFDAVAAAGPAGLVVDGLAERVGAGDTEHLTVLVDTLVALGLLETDDDQYRAAPAAAQYLLSDAATSMAALVRLSPGPHAAWPALADTIRSGHPSVRLDPAAFYPELVGATGPTQRAVAAAVAHDLDRRGWLPERATVVDLGAGSGAWTAQLLASRPGARAVAVDLPEVLGTTVRGLELAGVTDRAEAVGGDYLVVALPVERADVVVLAHVLRAEPPQRAQALLERALALVGPAGTVVVADYPRPAAGSGHDRAAQVAAARHELLLSLTMLASTSGTGLTLVDLRAWCAAGGATIVAELEPLPRQRVFLIRALDPKDAPS